MGPELGLSSPIYFASLEKQFVEEIRKRMNVVKEIQRINQEELEKGYDDRTS